MLDVQLCLLAPSGTALSDIRRVVSIPVATAQCQEFLTRELPQVEPIAANSTAEAAQTVGEEHPPGTAAIAPPLAGKLYGLDVVAADVADHDGNQTRFVAVARDGVAAPTGHDKTSVVVYQRAERARQPDLDPAGVRSPRRINLNKLESRPTKSGGLGDYCFIIDIEGHIADEVVADALRGLHSKQGGVKFLGSYPAGGDHGEAVRAEADTAWRDAEAWITSLRSKIH